MARDTRLSFIHYTNHGSVLNLYECKTLHWILTLIGSSLQRMGIGDGGPSRLPPDPMGTLLSLHLIRYGEAIATILASL